MSLEYERAIGTICLVAFLMFWFDETAVRYA